jgi:hypothetical protein
MQLLRALLNVSNPVQHILFPPHHQDPPDAIPKCKGFALVTLNEPNLASHFLSQFPYDGDNAPRRPTTSRPSRNQKRARQASALSPKNAGTRSKPSTQNTARASCVASPPQLPPPPQNRRPTKSKSGRRPRRTAAPAPQAAVVPVRLRAIRAARAPRHEQNGTARALFRPARRRGRA